MASGGNGAAAKVAPGAARQRRRTLSLFGWFEGELPTVYERESEGRRPPVEGATPAASVDARVVEGGVGAELDRPQTLLRSGLVQEPHLGARKPRLSSKQHEGFRHEWLRVRQVCEVVLQRSERERIRVSAMKIARSKLHRDQLDDANKQGWPQVLEDMRSEDAAERVIHELSKVGPCISMLDREPFRTAELDHVGVAIDTRSVDSGFT